VPLGEPVPPVTPNHFVQHWRFRLAHELASAEAANASDEQRAQLPLLRERMRMYDVFVDDEDLTEQDLVATLERVMAGGGPAAAQPRPRLVEQEARELLAKWQDPDRDAKEPYTF
jgi:hypothetical protein